MGCFSLQLTSSKLQFSPEKCQAYTAISPGTSSKLLHQFCQLLTESSIAILNGPKVLNDEAFTKSGLFSHVESVRFVKVIASSVHLDVSLLRLGEGETAVPNKQLLRPTTVMSTGGGPQDQVFLCAVHGQSEWKAVYKGLYPAELNLTQDIYGRQV